MKKLTVVALALAFAVPASASVLCQKRSGAVFFHSSCKRGETDVTGSVLSLLDTDGPGPKGDKGDTGNPGPFPATLPSGKTLTGLYRSDTYTNNGGSETTVFVSQVIGFTYPLAVVPTPNIVPIGGPPTAACPGTAANPQAAPGNLCVYAAQGSTPTCLYEPVSIACGTISRFGFSVFMFTPQTGSEGTWAVTAP